MKIKRINIDKNIFNFEEVKKFFEDTDDIPVFDLTTNESNKRKVDYKKIKKHFSKMNERPNIYGLYVKLNDSEWKLKYIGQRKPDGILQRLNNHLNSENKGTWSKYKKVQEALKKGRIGIKLLSVSPDPMRLYYEERLIKELCQNNWNEQKHK